MVRPARFGYNEETAKSNFFQNEEGKDNIQIPQIAQTEFDGVVQKLKDHQINVIVIDDNDDPHTPDAIFPNNWITTHENNIIITYAMESEVRRKEIREDILVGLENDYGFKKRYNFEHYADENLFLEGTGSIILDRPNRILYACLSPRTNIELISKFCILMNYRTVYFNAVDKENNQIYHTNVMMALGENLAVVCLECIDDEDKRTELKTSLSNTGKEIVEISLDQVYQFAGNMLEVRSNDLKRYLLMSTQAFNSLTQAQIQQIEQHDTILHFDISTIEKYGGGSLRCMLAEIFTS